jgi:hypothetical protein
MSRYSIILSGLAVAGLLAVGTPQALADPDVDGMDHSKLNHGVLGHGSHQDTAEHQNISVYQLIASNDPDVAGMDHSKLSHGVLGIVWKSPNR